MYFTKLAEPIQSQLATAAGGNLGIVGKMTNDGLFYGFRASDMRIAVAPYKTPLYECDVATSKFISSTLQHLPASDARALGARELQKSISELIASRQILGGTNWISERLLGRLNLITTLYEYELPSADGFDQICLKLQEQPRAWFSDDRDNDLFRTDDVLEDVLKIKDAGVSLPIPWWNDSGSFNEPDYSDMGSWKIAISEHYRRSLCIYRELVEANFPDLVPNLGRYTMLPIRYQIYLEGCEEIVGKRPRYSYHYVPVKDWSCSGADIDLADHVDMPDLQHWENVDRELRRFNRHSSQSRAEVGGVARFKYLDGRKWLGGFDGETSALREACDWLASDIDSLFSGLPH